MTLTKEMFAQESHMVHKHMLDILVGAFSYDEAPMRRQKRMIVYELREEMSGAELARLRLYHWQLVELEKLLVHVVELDREAKRKVAGGPRLPRVRIRHLEDLKALADWVCTLPVGAFQSSPGVAWPVKPPQARMNIRVSHRGPNLATAKREEESSVEIGPAPVLESDPV